MLLRNLLLIVLCLSFISTIFIGCVAWYGHNTFIELEEESKPVSDLIQSVTMIRNLQYDYLVSQEKRSLDQWNIIYNKALNQSSELTYEDPASEARIQRVKRSLSTLKTLFDTTTENPIRNLTDRSTYEQKVFSLRYQILNQQSLNAIDELSQMESGINEKKENIQSFIDLITLLTFTLVPFITFLSLLFLYSRLDKSLSQLEEGTRILGTGDLHHRIKIRGNDEFVTLAHSFNTMIEDLQKVLISRDLLKEEKQKAEAANRSKSVFLANISHELRTPLNAILGFSLLLSKDQSLNHSQISQLEIINKNGEHLLRIINDVLDMAKIESGRITTCIHPFDLHRLINSTFDLFSLQALEKGLEYEVTVSPDVPQFISSDEAKIRQILINLVGNAIKFTEKGSVLITADVQKPSPYIHEDDTWNENPELEVIIRVTDTGIGIAPGEMEIIFEPFEQTGEGRKRSGGTGLGLSISKKYAGLLGGSLVVQSSGVHGEGSVFIFTFPCSPVEKENIHVDVHVDSQVKKSNFAPDMYQDVRILIVDDIRENRDLLSAYHQTLGISPRLVACGKEAIRCVKKWHPHLVWIDIIMPNMNGTEVMKQIRGIKGEIPSVIIAVTSGAFDEQKKFYLDQGFDGVLAKPFTEDEVINILRTYLHIGFQYKRPDEKDNKGAGKPGRIQPSLTFIDRELLDQLKQSTKHGNITQIYQCIEKIREQDDQIAELIQLYAQSFNYEGILSLLEEGRS